ncbi:MAG TPA: ATP-binding protein [Candidatus Saccharimonadia bacterium]|nr:ATP-binding protein [Candidatus Saccharimonadia bacterium]
MDNHGRALHKAANYERVTRQVRWLTIGTALITIPPDQPQSLFLYGLMCVSAAYNMLHYLPNFGRLRLLSSRITMLVLDNLFVAALLLLVGSISTPYSAFLVFMIISAAYWYGLRGSLGVIAGQALALIPTAMWAPFKPLSLSEPRTIAISLLVLLIIGVFVERLTRAERQERHELEALSRDNQTERERLLNLVNSLNDAIFMIDDRGRIILHNGAAQALVSAKGELRGRDLTKVLPLQRRSKQAVSLVELAQGNTDPQQRRDLGYAAPDGSITDLDISITPVRLGAAGAINYIIVGRDITKEKSLDQQREEFIAVASHELRTPLTIVEAALSTALLAKPQLSSQLTLLLEQAHRNTVFLGSIVRDLTTLSQAQDDTIPIQLRPVNPKLLLEQLVNDFMPQAKEKNLSLKLVLLPNTPSILSTEHHIHEVLQNYLTNAMKYTQEGGIIVKAAPSQNGGVLFAVQDSGIGISASDQRHLFTKFYRSEDYRTRETGGTGLGLYLCLELAERLNAKVWCKSTLNHGSTFYLEVPPFSQLQRDHAKVVEAEVSTLIDQL